MTEGKGLRVHTPKPWTIDDIRARCDEIGECLVWKLTTDECGRPVAYMAGAHTSVRKFVYEHNGGKLRSGYYPVPRCGDKRCLAHLALLPRSKINRESRERSLLIPANWREHQLRPSRAKLTPELAAVIRSSDEPEEVLAERHGVKRRAIKRVRAGETWKPSPAVSSVWSFAAAMGAGQ